MHQTVRVWMSESNTVIHLLSAYQVMYQFDPFVVLLSVKSYLSPQQALVAVDEQLSEGLGLNTKNPREVDP